MANIYSCIGKENKIEIIKEIHFPHSLGLLYSAFTYYLGFKVNSGEYKIMGLAPYVRPKYSKIIKENLIDIKQDGSFKINMNYFNYATDLTMTNKKFAELFQKTCKKTRNRITYTISHGYSSFNTRSYRRNSIKNCKKYE